MSTPHLSLHVDFCTGDTDIPTVYCCRGYSSWHKGFADQRFSSIRCVLLVGVSLCCPAVDPPSAMMTDADIGLGKTVSTERELQVCHVIVM